MKCMKVNSIVTFLLLVSYTNAQQQVNSKLLRGTSAAEEPTRNLQSTNVNCGGHTADRCSDCPFDGSLTFRGANWCNGECVWEHDPVLFGYGGTTALQCRPRKANDVDCGYYASRGEDRAGIFRATCGDCINPFFHEESSKASRTFCGGECRMDGDNCIPKPSVEDLLNNPNATVSIRNLSTLRYIAQISDRIEMEELPSSAIPAALWKFEQEECPPGSTAEQQGRACYSIRNVVETTFILGTNGENAFRHSPPANSISLFTVEETDNRCTSSSTCTVNLQVSFYGDIYLADLEADPRVYVDVPVRLTQLSGGRLPSPTGKDSTWQMQIFTPQ